MLQVLRRKKWALAAGLMFIPAAFAVNQAQSSDHGDTAENINRIGADLTDLYIFPSPQNPANVVFVMDVHGLIPAGQGPSTSFDPNVLYQFKIDTNNDAREDLVMQAKFDGTGTDQTVRISGPVKPSQTGTSSVFEKALPTTGTLNRPFTPAPGIRVFAGAREDPFFFDLDRFYQILPDRKTPVLPPKRDNDINTPEPNTPRVNGFRPPGEARDFFRNINVLSIVVELPKARFGTNNISVWMTTSVAR
jgi:hypothetical protein